MLYKGGILSAIITGRQLASSKRGGPAPPPPGSATGYHSYCFYCGGCWGSCSCCSRCRCCFCRCNCRWSCRHCCRRCCCCGCRRSASLWYKIAQLTGTDRCSISSSIVVNPGVEFFSPIMWLLANAISMAIVTLASVDRKVAPGCTHFDHYVNYPQHFSDWKIARPTIIH